LRIAKRVALVALAIFTVAIIGWNIAPDWFRAGLIAYARQNAFMDPIQRYERWRVHRAGYSYEDILSKCSRSGEGNVSLLEAVTIRDAEYVVAEQQVKVNGNMIVADVPMQLTSGKTVIPTQQHCEYDISTGAVLRSEMLRVKR
jgi:hypothetical protein